jgi:hypothetical protein
MARRLLLPVVVAVAFTLAGFTALSAAKQAQPSNKQTASDKGVRSRGSADNDPNIKTKEGLNDPAKDMPAPANKGGEKTRAMACSIDFDNYTPWLLQLFIDGNYVGVVGPYGDQLFYDPNMAASLYARALFTDGSVLTWGPRTISCNGSYTWRLNR